MTWRAPGTLDITGLSHHCKGPAMAQHLPPQQGSSAGSEADPSCCPIGNHPLRFDQTLARGLVSDTGVHSRQQSRTSQPFVWQHRDHVLFLELQPVGWVVAELRFDASRCQYVEAHRAIYHWPREAAGAFLARAIQADAVLVATLATNLNAWVTAVGARAC